MTISSSTAVKTAICFQGRTWETTPSYKTPERPNMKPCGWELPYNLICSMANSSPWTKPKPRCPPKPSTAMPHRKMYSSTIPGICYFNLSLSGKGVPYIHPFHDLRYLHTSTFRRNTHPQETYHRHPFSVSTVPFPAGGKNFGPGIRCEKSVNNEGILLSTPWGKGGLHPKGKKAPQTTASIPICWSSGPFAGCTGHVPLAELTGRGGPHPPVAEMLTDEITAGCTDELEKIRHDLCLSYSRTYATSPFETDWQDIGPTGSPGEVAQALRLLQGMAPCCAHC